MLSCARLKNCIFKKKFTMTNVQFTFGNFLTSDENGLVNII